MAVKSDVKVTIDIQRPTPKLGFGKTLIIGSSATGHPYTTYTDLDAVRADFAANTEVYKAALSIFLQDNAPAEIAVMLYKAPEQTLTDFLPQIFKKDWYFLVSTSSQLSNITTIADAVELYDNRQFFASTSSKDDLGKIYAKKYNNTTMFYHIDTSNYPEAAWLGEVAAEDVGSVTWKGKTLKGIVPLDIDDTELQQIHAVGANTYVTKAGDDVTSEGKTVSGEYIDVIHSKHYLILSIEYGIQKLMNRSSKIPFDNNGIAMLEGETLIVLKRGDQSGMIAHDDDDQPLYSTNFKPRSQIDPADRAQRVYTGGSFSFELAGAIH
ncbi:DUF3383 family protein, partial [Paenibacillus sp. RC84]|uniref:DUF3383 family protein n=1 Tax=Paenibacillus sp. RC84 TaxID=3156252 RepID=UPI003514196E